VGKEMRFRIRRDLSPSPTAYNPGKYKSIESICHLSFNGGTKGILSNSSHFEKEDELKKLGPTATTYSPKKVMFDTSKKFSIPQVICAKF
jgi:hypothetical protein